ncbi:MAG TPA: hypothetical protein VML19_24850 [Verrucomicrobiae bacterium]|nr:hypothetical protein [Verrucomicrobiae bacterium]
MGKKILGALILLSGCNAFASVVVAPMPEPAEFPELLIALAGAGVLLWLGFKWRRRGDSSIPNGTKAIDSGR